MMKHTGNQAGILLDHLSRRPHAILLLHPTTLVKALSMFGLCIGLWLKKCKIKTFNVVAGILLASFSYKKEHFAYAPLYFLIYPKISITVEQARGFSAPVPWPRAALSWCRGERSNA